MAKYIRIKFRDQPDLLSLYKDGDDTKTALARFEKHCVDARNANRDVPVYDCEVDNLFRLDGDHHKFDGFRFVNPNTISQFFAENDDAYSHSKEKSDD